MMEKIEQSEQWKLNGDCRLCRKKNYCSKPCTRCKRETRLMLRSMVSQALDKATDGAYSEILDRAERVTGYRLEDL